ncbi:MAG: hypothetical protein WC615_06570 [Mucilaginibacter sp.]|jgi:hypothetical protein
MSKETWYKELRQCNNALFGQMDKSFYNDTYRNNFNRALDECFWIFDRKVTCYMGALYFTFSGGTPNFLLNALLKCSTEE